MSLRSSSSSIPRLGSPAMIVGTATTEPFEVAPAWLVDRGWVRLQPSR